MCFDQKTPEGLVDGVTPNVITAYDKWKADNNTPNCYMLVSVSSMLQKKHENMGMTIEIMVHLEDLYGEHIRRIRSMFQRTSFGQRCLNSLL